MKTLLAALLVCAAATPVCAQESPAPTRQMDDAEVPHLAAPPKDAGPRLLPTVPVTVAAPSSLDVPPPLVAPAPPIAAWSPDDKRSYKLVRNNGLIVAGASLLGVSWGSLAVTAGVYGIPDLAIPIAGPIWMASIVGAGDPFGGLITTLFVMDAVTQAAGITLIIVGSVTKHKAWNPPVTLVPIASRDLVGAGVSFRF
jgi:hypothetical protein